MKKLKKRFIVPAVEVKPFLKKFTEETRKFYCKGEERAFTISLGFAEYPVLADDRSQLMRCADMALYGVKMHGKNGCMEYYKCDQVKSRAKLGFIMKDIIDICRELSLFTEQIKKMMKFCLQTVSCLGLQAVKIWTSCLHIQVRASAI